MSASNSLVSASPSGRRPVVAAALISAALALLTFTVVTGGPVQRVAPLVAVFAIVVVVHGWLFRWDTLLAMLVAIIFFIPIKRYGLPGHLPFSLEPYRVYVFLIVLAWASALLVDRRVSLRRSSFEGPIVAILLTAVASELANPGRATSLLSYIVKSMTFLASFLLVFYLIVSVVRTRAQIDHLLRVIVAFASVVAFFGLIERRTHYNVFNHLSTIIPLLKFKGAGEMVRSGHLRVLGSSQHPIAMGAAFALVLPLAFYVAQRSGKRRWWFASVLIVAAAFATGSRTAIVMLVEIIVVFLILRPKETRRFWPALLPAVLLIHFAAPGALGTIRSSFFPKGGLLAQQDNHKANAKNAQLANGRVADLGPAFHHELAPDPALGEGFGTRLTGYNEVFTNAPILDDQWLGTLLETGFIGAFAWVWLFFRTTRSLGRAAKRERTAGEGWLFVSLTASSSSFAVGMFFYDAFSFIQVTFLLYIVLAIGAAALNEREGAAKKPRTLVLQR